MTRRFSLLGSQFFVVLLLFLSAARLLAARNGVVWNYVNLPDTGSVGQTIHVGVSVTNGGDTTWGANHHLELSSQSGVHLNYLELAGTAPGSTKTALFALTLPLTPGTYTYRFAALEHGVEYFGPSIIRTMVVRPLPLDISLTLDDATILVGERATVRSSAGPDQQVAKHGLEGRALGGYWQSWVQWDDDGGEEQLAFPVPATAGIYEIRAYAAREGDDPTYSARSLLIVSDVAPVITRPPVGAVANVGENVTLSVAASGTEPAFQWRKDGVDLAGASRATLALSPAQIAQSGSYSVVVANSAGAVASRPVAVTISALSLPAVAVEAWNFPAGASKRAVSINAAQVGDVVSINSVSTVTAGTGWRHNLLVRRPVITTATAMAPEDGSGLLNAAEAWNRDGWGNPHADGGSYDASVTGQPAADLGNREPFMHPLATGQTSSTRAFDFVLDAPGAWLIRAEIVDGSGQLVAASATTTVTVANATLAGDAAGITYPYGRDDKFVGVFWNAGQAHRLWSTWRADHQGAYAATWAVNWKLMWQPSPYFRRADGGWLRADPIADSPWQPFWSAHQVYALVPDGTGGSTLTHDVTSQAFAEKAALRLMDIGVDFVAVDYTNQFLEESEDVLPAVNHLAQAFQAVAVRAQSGQRIKLAAVVPANVSSGDWSGSGGFTPVAIGRFNAKLSLLYERYARFESAWFYLEDDDGARKPLLLLWIGAGGESEADGTLSPAKLDELRLADGRRMTDVFTIRWVGAYLAANRRFLTGASYTVAGASGAVKGDYANPKTWAYHDDFPSAATIMPGVSGSGPTPAVEAVTVQPLAAGRDRFGRVWDQNWPAGQGYHYETPSKPGEPVPLANYGTTWSETLTAARALNPKFLLTTWAEFGSENDEPRPELSVTIMDNNKFGTHFGDALKQAVRLFKYRAPTGWLDTYAVDGIAHWFTEDSAAALPAFRPDRSVRLQGWVTPNVATTFAGGNVTVFVDGQPAGNATVGGAWNGATRWSFELSVASLRPGPHEIKVICDDGAGGSSAAGVQFRGEAPRNVLPIVVTPASP